MKIRYWLEMKLARQAWLFVVGFTAALIAVIYRLSQGNDAHALLDVIPLVLLAALSGLSLFLRYRSTDKWQGP